MNRMNPETVGIEKMNRIRRWLLALVSTFMSTLALSAAAWAASSGVALSQAPIDPDDLQSVRRGAALFANHCQGCHAARHMRYDRMTEDLGISAEQLRANLIFTGAQVADPMLSAMREDDAREWFHQAVPPDLTLVSRVRGTDWLYNFLRAYYRDPERPTGWNNAVYENTAMPNVLADLQGIAERDPETGALSVARPGLLPTGEFNLLVADLVNFLHYIAEPSRKTRLATGYAVMAFLLTALVAAFLLYREYWKDIS